MFVDDGDTDTDAETEVHEELIVKTERKYSRRDFEIAAATLFGISNWKGKDFFFLLC